jgi:hypothetical protein
MTGMINGECNNVVNNLAFLLRIALSGSDLVLTVSLKPP